MSKGLTRNQINKLFSYGIKYDIHPKYWQNRSVTFDRDVMSEIKQIDDLPPTFILEESFTLFDLPMYMGFEDNDNSLRLCGDVGSFVGCYYSSGDWYYVIYLDGNFIKEERF